AATARGGGAVQGSVRYLVFIDSRAILCLRPKLVAVGLAVKAPGPTQAEVDEKGAGAAEGPVERWTSCARA
ncbi:MAG: hypothetical protein ACPIOQ_73820, partial [Promethearchaeia archaeon]